MNSETQPSPSPTDAGHAESGGADPLRFTLKILPCVIGAAALLLYLVTLNPWVTLASLPATAKATGWDWWTLTLQAPLQHLLTLPVRLLPAAWQPAALNLFGAVCAALSVALLARSVALMPQDRTREQRVRERDPDSLLSIRANWAPPLLAALLLALQLTFWENAVAFSGEMLNLLIFAWVVHSLLAYRVDRREGRLHLTALVYGVGMVNNWAMIGFLPLFLIALLWIKGREFFRWKFLLKMSGFGALGLSLYLYLPLLESLSDNPADKFWPLLRMELGIQKNALLAMPKWVALILSLSSLLPLLGISIRWPSSFSDVNAAGAALTNLMFHVVHIMFLAVCVWVMFDPPFSPRALGFGMPFLTFYYLSALCVGYLAGYFLLVFGTEPAKSWGRTPGYVRLINRAITGAAWLVIIGAPLVLAWQNIQKVRATNSPWLRQFAGHYLEALPSGKTAVVLSDNPMLLLLIEAALAQRGGNHSLQLVDTRSLAFTVYHRDLKQKYGEQWPEAAATDSEAKNVHPLAVARLVQQLSAKSELYYLHPAFGHLFLEQFHLVPNGLVFQLRARPAQSLQPPSPAPEALASNREFWQAVGSASDNWKPWIESKNPEAVMIGRYYSRAANFWGTAQQQAGDWEGAAKSFALALELNPENVAAIVNQAFNASRDKETDAAKAARLSSDKLGRYRTWSSLLTENGPFDEPSFCEALGKVYIQFGLARQGADQFIRASELEPDNLNHRLALAEICLRMQMPDQALATIEQTRAHPQFATLELPRQISLTRMEALARFRQNKFPEAEALLENSLKQHPKDVGLLDALAQIYLLSGRFTNAMTAIDRQLEASPSHVGALLNKGALLLTFKDYEGAVDYMNRVLKIQPGHLPALMNRAIARLHLNRLDEALADYQAVREGSPALPGVHYGLGEIALRRKQHAEAARHFEEFLKIAPPGTKEIPEVREKLEKLKTPAN